MPITLKAREFEVLTVVPIEELSDGTKFAPIGLIEMFNSGGAIKEVRPECEGVSIKVRGCGLFGAYSSLRPKRLTVDSKEVSFEYEERSGLISVCLSTVEKELHHPSIGVEYAMGGR